MILDPAALDPDFHPRFIVFEGINGCGKSTLMKSFAARLAARGRECISTFEPGDTPLGAGIRTLVLERPELSIDPVAELLLFGADRAQHISGVIAPALQQQKIVLCDRYMYSMAAFQGYGRKLDRSLIEAVNTIAVQTAIPDLVVLLDVDVPTALGRLAARNDKSVDRLEHEEISFHERIREGFLEIARTRPEPFLVLDGRRTPPEVLDELTNPLKELLR